MSNEKKDSLLKRYTFPIILFTAVLIWVLYLLIIEYYSKGHSDFSKSEFGDMFGAITALFSAITLAGLIYTLQLQRSSVDIQNESLKNQKREMKQMENQYKEQIRSLKLQQFESTFFKLLEFQNNISESICCDLNSEKVLGREVFERLFTEFFPILKGYTSEEQLQHPVELFKINAYTFFDKFEKYKTGLHSYLANLHLICKLINQLDEEDGSKYCDILIAQLSQGEIYLLFLLIYDKPGYSDVFVALERRFNVSKNLYFSNEDDRFIQIHIVHTTLQEYDNAPIYKEQ